MADATVAGSSSSQSQPKVQIVGELPPAPTMSSKDRPVNGNDTDSDDDRTHAGADEDEDPQTEDEAGPSSAVDEPEPANNGITRGIVQYGSVRVDNSASNGQITEAPAEEIPDDAELLQHYPDTEQILDLGHLRLTTTKRLGLARFAPSLKRLCLRQNLLTKIRSDIGQLTELEDLDLYDNSIEKITHLDSLTQLESLDLSFNNIHHISNVSHLGACKTIYFVQNKISRVRADDLQGPIAGALESLELGGNRLRSIENIGHLTNLTQLWLGKNKITTLSGMESLTNLRVLSIQSNRITKLEGLETLVNLEELYISHNGLTKLEGLEHNTKLTTLDVGANMIEKVENVGHLSRLEEFWANDNRIADLNELDKELGPNRMPALETVYLEGNPAQKKEGPAYRRKVKLLLPQLKQIDATFIRG
ncbi:Leucine rich repeat 4 [Kalmanozyma brasiliensis GHG001]|uniref:Leucine rich repeat n=1 Tax=Kalmanozyma brasiliensis (strain GHG001) TaxID=1365824 RepID=V5GNB9_KALBG|nr:Leucine rich repeat 4 [Kalmanozyma brasiliensis GHG001]EST07457.1 Leucine rich repeat 4 [Kalmanozyma brasiliensis GHG001]